MGYLVTGDQVSRWVSGQLGITVEIEKTAGVGWADEDGMVTQGAAFYNYSGRNMYVHVALLPEHRIVPTFLAAMMDYPFRQAKVHRLTGLIPAKNECGKALAVSLGGVLEGCLRECLANDDLLVYGLVQQQAERWLTAPYQRRLRRNIGVAHGQVVT